jgi:hypothetical protein
MSTHSRCHGNLNTNSVENFVRNCENCNNCYIVFWTVSSKQTMSKLKMLWVASEVQQHLTFERWLMQQMASGFMEWGQCKTGSWGCVLWSTSSSKDNYKVRTLILSKALKVHHVCQYTLPNADTEKTHWAPKVQCCNADASCTFSEKSSQVTILGVSCMISKVNDKPLSGCCHYHLVIKLWQDYSF